MSNSSLISYQHLGECSDRLLRIHIDRTDKFKTHPGGYYFLSVIILKITRDRVSIEILDPHGFLYHPW